MLMKAHTVNIQTDAHLTYDCNNHHKHTNTHSPVDKRLVWTGIVWFGMQESEVLFRCRRRIRYERDLAF